MHPAVFFLGWLALTVLAQFLDVTGLLVMAFVLLLAGPSCWRKWWQLIRRARWLLIVMWGMLAYAQPGNLVAGREWAPSWEGVYGANLQFVRLLIVLGLLGVLLTWLSRDGLVVGIWALASRCLPRPWATRLVVRLSLVLAYVDEHNPREAWKDLLHAPDVGAESMTLVLPGWHWRDAVALAGILLFALGMVLCDWH